MSCVLSFFLAMDPLVIQNKKNNAYLLAWSGFWILLNTVILTVMQDHTVDPDIKKIFHCVPL